MGHFLSLLKKLLLPDPRRNQLTIKGQLTWYGLYFLIMGAVVIVQVQLRAESTLPSIIWFGAILGAVVITSTFLDWLTLKRWTHAAEKQVMRKKVKSTLESAKSKS